MLKISIFDFMRVNASLRLDGLLPDPVFATRPPILLVVFATRPPFFQPKFLFFFRSLIFTQRFLKFCLKQSAMNPTAVASQLASSDR